MSANPINETQAINSLEACQAALTQISDYLENRDDCWDENIDKATDALRTAIWRITRQQEEIEDGARYAKGDDLFREMKADDDRMRAADIRAEQRR
jgi:vacuolar-type H+-ATPase catalytic subunit A/Vma1